MLSFLTSCDFQQNQLPPERRDYQQSDEQNPVKRRTFFVEWVRHPIED
jgi:hypothetical protein